jgi:soluble lytic murein transglycosylase
MMDVRKTFLAVLTGSMLLSNVWAAAAKPDDPLRHSRELFKKAYQQVDSSGALPQSTDSEALRVYPLYPYLQAARIRRALANLEETAASAELSPIDQRAQTFITSVERDPVGRDLRRVWLASLAERGRWATFIEHYRPETTDDALRCQSFRARIELGRTEGLAAEIAKQWLTPRSLPDCEHAFEWLRGQGLLTVALIEQRVKLALEDNNPAFARQLIVPLPPERAAALREWAALLDNPQRQIEALIADPERAVEPDALLAGWKRFARVNRDLALRRHGDLVRARGMTEMDASPYSLALALALAWDRRPEALEYFKRVAPAHLDDYALEWQARAALWAEQWQLAKQSIAAMSDTQRELARWRYWAARAAEHTGDPKLARQLYESVLADDNFYSAMAAARLEQPLAPHPEKLVADAVLLEQVEQLPAMVRARELVLSGMRSLATAEWNHGYETLPEPARVQAVHLAAKWGWHDQAIMTASQQRLFNDYALLYPRPFEREVRMAAKLTELRPELIYSVMRQESLYRSDAVSSAGARGLLQLMPETARRTARNLKRSKPSADDLFAPEINLPLGAAHLRTLIDRFGGQVIVALAGYNAGPNAAARWLPAQSVEPDVWIENIPYNETRNYVQRILWHSVVFGWLNSGEPQKTERWLARVVPLSESTVLGAR